jgi:hypothetical protein
MWEEDRKNPRPSRLKNKFAEAFFTNHVVTETFFIISSLTTWLFPVG